MDLFGRFKKLDSSLQRGLDNSFARVFGGEVVPTEIDELLKQYAEESVMVDSSGRTLAPSFFVVKVSARDHHSLFEAHPQLDAQLSDRLARFIRNQGWHTNSPARVTIEAEPGLHSGQLHADARFDTPPTDSPAESPNTPKDDVNNHSYQDNSPAADQRPEWPQREGTTHSPVAKDYDVNRVSPAGNTSDATPSSAYPADEAAAPSHAPAGSAGAAAGGLADIIREGARFNTPSAQPQSQESNPYPAQDQPSGQPNPGPDGSHAPSQHGVGAHTPPPSYPGTEVIAQAAPEQPIRGGQGQGDGNQPTVTLILRDGSGRSYTLRKGSNLIGRGNGVDLRIPDTGVSRQHADIAWDGYDAVLTDLQSTNGTTVNETPVENWLLADKDIIALGHSEIEVRFG